MDIVRKRGVKGGQGNAVSEYSDIIGRAGSWQYGNDARVNDVEDEKREEDLAFGTPHEKMDFDPKKGLLAQAVDLGTSAVKSVADNMSKVKENYKATSQQTNQMPAELKEAARMKALGQQALDQDKPAPQQGK